MTREEEERLFKELRGLSDSFDAHLARLGGALKQMRWEMNERFEEVLRRLDKMLADPYRPPEDRRRGLP